MSSDMVIRAEGLGKRYRMYDRPEDRLKELIFPKRSFGKDFWALRGVDFEIRRGETIGIIGRNGSGKSTLLQLVCGTTQPTTGELEVQGRVAALLELGAGFNPDFTGRENVYLSATVLGLTTAEIDERFAAIEAFAEIGEFIDQPVRKYSSGMYARLAFSVCAHVDADVLVVDEILGVGDAGFQQRCMRYFNEFRKHGTLLFVSHDEGAVLSLCDRALWLNDGMLAASGRSKEVCRQYRSYLAGRGGGGAGFQIGGEVKPTAPANSDEAPKAFDFDLDAVDGVSDMGIIDDARLLTPTGDPADLADVGSDVVLHVTVTPDRDLDQPVIGFVVRNRLGQVVVSDTTARLTDAVDKLEAGRSYRATFRFLMPHLPGGEYSIEPSLFERQGAMLVDRYLDRLFVRVQADIALEGLANLFVHKATLSYEDGESSRTIGGVLIPTENLPPQDRRWMGASRIDVLPFDGNAPWHGVGGAVIRDIGFFSPDGHRLDRIEGGSMVELRITARAEREIEAPVLGFILRNELGQNVSGHNTFPATREEDRRAAAGELMIARFHFPMPYLANGEYAFAPSVIDGTQASHVHVHWVENALTLRVAESPVQRGVVGMSMVETTFRLDNEGAPSSRRRAGVEQ